MTKSSTSLSLIITTFNRFDALQLMVESIRIQPENNAWREIIVVDQGQCKKVEALVEDLESAIYIASEKIGISANRNLGIKKATGDYIAFVDDDAVLGNDYFQKAVEVIYENNEIDCFAGLIVNSEDEKPFSRYMKKKSVLLNMCDYDSFMSSNIIVAADIFETIGIFDESFGAGAQWGASEDADLFLRAQLAGKRLMFSTDICVKHPRTDFSIMTCQQVKQKMFNYGKGRGALIRKLFWRKPIWFFYHALTNLAKPFIGFLIALFIFDKTSRVRFFASLAGRVSGIIKYQAHTRTL